MPDKRLDAARRTATALSLFALLCLAAGAAQGDQTNIVILFADDLGYGSVSSYGSDIPTPHIDSIGRNGIRFTSGYMTAPVCNPSRNGLMTGRYQQRWGKELNSGVNPPIGAARGTLGIGHTTIANALEKVGYANAAIGKWQLGMRELLHPLDRGFRLLCRYVGRDELSGPEVARCPLPLGRRAQDLARRHPRHSGAYERTRIGRSASTAGVRSCRWRST